MRRGKRILVRKDELWHISQNAAVLGVPKKRIAVCVEKYGAKKTLAFLHGIRKLSLALQIDPKELREILKKHSLAQVFSQLRKEFEQQQIVRGG